MCINARADPNSTHVPFRDSKLTRLLQVDTLLGNNLPSCRLDVLLQGRFLLFVNAQIDGPCNSWSPLRFSLAAFAFHFIFIYSSKSFAHPLSWGHKQAEELSSASVGAVCTCNICAYVAAGVIGWKCKNILSHCCG